MSIFIICEDVTSCENTRNGESAGYTGSSQVKKFDAEPDKATVEDMLEKMASGRLGNILSSDNIFQFLQGHEPLQG